MYQLVVMCREMLAKRFIWRRYLVEDLSAHSFYLLGVEADLWCVLIFFSPHHYFRTR
jgi:hypothetical protein